MRPIEPRPSGIGRLSPGKRGGKSSRSWSDLDENGERATWRAVGELRQREPALYNRFVGERLLRDLLVDIVADHDGAMDFPILVEEVTRRAESAEEWLIAVPLANLLVPGGYC
jgi:hypothetical protein